MTEKTHGQVDVELWIENLANPGFGTQVEIHFPNSDVDYILKRIKQAIDEERQREETPDKPIFIDAGEEEVSKE